MARGELVPDDVVVAIVADRIDQPDARNGFILDGFPRTVPQARALDRMLVEKGQGLDAVIELKMDENSLLKRIENRVAEMTARQEALRADDNPESLKRRLRAYRDQTEPLLAYYAMQGALRSVNGMAPIPAVAASIDQVLSQPPRKKAPQAAAAVRGAPKGAGKASDAPKTSSRTATAGREAQAGKAGRVKSAKKAASGRRARGKPAAKKVARAAKQPSRKAGRQQRLTKKR